MEPIPEPEWSEEVIALFGELPIWTATWHEHYVQHERHLQTYQEALHLARQYQGYVVLRFKIRK